MKTIFDIQYDKSAAFVQPAEMAIYFIWLIFKLRDFATLVNHKGQPRSGLDLDILITKEEVLFLNHAGSCSKRAVPVYLTTQVFYIFPKNIFTYFYGVY
jgi:hypothetical protein